MNTAVVQREKVLYIQIREDLQDVFFNVKNKRQRS